MEEKKVSIVHYIITAAIIFGFRFLPPFSAMTPYGMGILGTFIGAIYGWSVIGMVWPSFMALVGLGLSIGMTNLLYASFGNPVVAALFALFPMMAVLSELHITEIIANSFLTNRLSLGRPWVAIFILLTGAYICSFINVLLVMLIFGAFLVDLCKKVGIAPYTKLPTTLMLGLAYALMNGQIVFPFIGTGLTFTAAYQGMFQSEMPFAKYMLFIIPMGMVMNFVYLLIMRFVFRVDVSPLANLTEDMLGEKQKMTRDQKIVSGFFVAFVIVMICSSVLPKTWLISQFLGSLTFFGIAVLFTGVMMLVKDVNGKPLLKFNLMAAKGMAWEPILLTAYIMVISVYLTNADTGVGATLGGLLQPMTHFPPMVFIILAMLFGTIVTNVANNLILTIIIMPVMVNFASQVGMEAVGLVLLLFMATQMALATPGASPVTGIAFTFTSLVKSGDMSKYALIAIPILFVCCMFFGLIWMNIVF